MECESHEQGQWSVRGVNVSAIVGKTLCHRGARTISPVPSVVLGRSVPAEQGLCRGALRCTTKTSLHTLLTK